MTNRFTRKFLQGAVLVAIAASMPTAWADGVKGVQVTSVAVGSAAISRVGNTMTVRTGTSRTIINYQRLSVGSGETLQFLQPSSNSRVLNRIKGNEPTVIDGTVYSNGKVYFVNPAGVMFGEGSVINVGNMIAAAGHMSDADFMAGVNRFTNNTGTVTNYGVIHADQIHLVGANVANFGQILTTGSGIVTMTAGKDVYIAESNSPTGDTTVMVKVSAEKGTVKDGTAVTNSGKVDAGGGQISMGAGDLYAAGIYNNGALRAANIVSDSGASTNVNEGKMDASNANGKGGKIEMVGDKVGVFAGTVDASGKTGGGSIKIGGDFHGAAGTPASSQTVVGPTAVIKADALASGDGGKIAVWSDGVTEFAGFASARGGALSGNGGFIEISGKQNLAFTGGADVSAIHGLSGTLLFDPETITIGTANTDDSALGISFTTTGNHNYIFSAGAIVTLSGAVTLTATDDINVDTSLNLVGSGVTSLSLVTTTGDINIAGGSVIQTAAQPVALNSGHDIFMADSGGAASAEIRTTTGDVTLTAVHDIVMQASNGDAFAAKITTGGGAVLLSAGNGILLDSGNGGAARITTSGGAITLRSKGGMTLEGNSASIHASLSSTGSGTGGAILLSTGDTTLGGTAGTIALGDDVLLTSGGGNITLRSTGLSFGANNQFFVAGTGVVAFEPNDPALTIGVGSGAGTLSISNGNLADVFTSSLVRIGVNGAQTGLITVQNAVVIGQDLEINGNGAGGEVAIDDNGGVGLSVTRNLTLRAGSGGITVTQGDNNNAEITMSGAGSTLTLASGGGIGLAGNHLGIDGSAGRVDVTAAGDVYLTSLGTNGIVFGTVSDPGNLFETISGGDINASGTITAGSIVLNASGGIGTTGALALNVSGGGTLTSHGAGSAGNVHILATTATLGAFTFVNTGSGTQVDTIDSTGNLSLANGVTGPTTDSLVVNASGSLFAAGAAISGLSVTLHSGTTGAGDLDLTGAQLTGDTINLIAGNGSGSGAIGMAGTVFAGLSGAEPVSVSVEQDLGLADLPNAGSTTALTVLSHLGTIGISSDHLLGSLSATGTSLVLSANTSASGAISLNGPVLLTGSSALVAGTSLTITGLIGAAPGGFFFTTSAPGVTTLTQGFDPTAGKEVGSFNVAAAGGTLVIGNGGSSHIRVINNADIQEQLLLNGTLTVTSTGGGIVEFFDKVDSAGSPHSPLIVNNAGLTIFDGDVGSVTPLGGVSVLGGGQIVLGNATSPSFAISVGSPILMSGPVTLGANTTLTASGGTTGTVTFQDVVLSAGSEFFTLTIHASDAVAFSGDVGDLAGGALGGLDVTGSAIVFGDGVSDHLVAVTGAQAYHGPVTLLSNMQFLGLDVVTFDDVVASGTGSHATLSIDTGLDISFKKGTSTASATMLQSIIATSSAGAINVGGSGGGTMVTIGSQEYASEVVLGENATFQVTGAGSQLHFAGGGVAVSAGAFDLTLIADSMAFGGTVTGSGHLAIQPLATTDNILIQAATGTAANTLVLAAGQMALLNGFASVTIGYANGSGTISVTSPTVFGATTILQAPSGGRMVVSSNITSAGDLTLHANTIGLGASLFTRGGSMTVQGAINLTSNVTLQSYGTAGAAGNITVIGAVNGARVLNILANGPGGNGDIDVQGVIGGSTPLTGLNVSGGTFTVHNNITTAGPVNLGNTQTLLDTGTGGTTNFAIITAGGAVQITSALDATGSGTANLAISSSAGGAAGAITLGNVGTTTPLNNLTLVATGATGGLVTLPGTVHVGGTLSISSGGANQSGSGTIQASMLLLQGVGTFTLANANQVATIAADVTGPLSYGSVSDVTAGTVTGTGGINTHGGSLTINASGFAFTATGPILAGVTSLTAGTITIGGGLVSSGSVTATGTTAVNSSVSATAILVVGDSTINGDMTATTGSIRLRGNSTIAANMTAATSVLLGNLATDVTNFSGNHFVIAGGSISISGPSVLLGTGGPTVLTASGAGGIAFNGSISGAHSLRALATAGGILIDGPIVLTGSGSTTLTGLTGVTASGSITSSQTLIVNATNGKVWVTDTIVLTGSGNSTFASGALAGVELDGDVTSSQTLTLLADSGSLGLAGSLTLTGTGTTTLTAAGTSGISIGGSVVSSQNLTLAAATGGIALGSGLTLTGTGTTTLTAGGAAGISVAGPITGSQGLHMTTNATAGSIAVGPIGVSAASRYTGTVTLTANSAQNVNGVVLNGDVFVGGIVFDGAHATVPTVATIVAPGSLVIDAANLIDMRANQKLTALGSLTLRSHASPSAVGIFVGDLGALGTIVVDAGGAGALGLGRINIRVRSGQSELGHNGSPLGNDGGADIVSYSPTPVSSGDAGFGAGNTTIAIRGNVSIIGVPGPVNINSTKVQFVSATANFDIVKSASGDPNATLLFPVNQGGILTTNHGIPILPRILDPGTALSAQAGDLSNINKTVGAITGADLVIASGPLTGTYQDLVPTGTTGDTPTPSAQAALIPQDVQTLFPERGEAISGALAEALQQLGIYARPLDSEELVDELLGRGMYNDTLRVLTPVDSSHTVAVNRLPSVPVLPVVEAARALMYREERDEKGNVKLVSRTDEIAAAIGLAWQADLDEAAAKTPPEEAKPAEFRAYLERHEKDDAKFATALAYLNQIRDLLNQIKLLGLTPTEIDVSRRVILNKMRDKDRIDERDFAVMVDGPSSRTGGKVAVETPAPAATK